MTSPFFPMSLPIVTFSILSDKCKVVFVSTLMSKYTAFRDASRARS